MGRKWKLLWPERRMVDDATIIGWAKDAVANGQLHSELDTSKALDCAQALDQAGLITLETR